MKGRNIEMAEAENASAMLRAADLLIRLGGGLAALLILVMFAIVTYAVTQRYVFNAPLMWGDELIGYLLVATVMLGAAEAFRCGDHIAIDLVASRAKGRQRLLLGLLIDLSVIVFSGILGWSAWKSIQFARAFGSYSVGYIEIETWIPQVPLVFGAGLLTLAAVADMIRLIGRADAT